MKGVLVTTDDKVEIRDFPEPLFKTVGEAVGGYIEIVHPRYLQALGRDFIMIVNEEGRILELELNALGSALYGTLEHGQPILGNIVIMKEGFVDGEPDLVGLTDEEAQDLNDRLQQTVANVNKRRK